MESSSTFQGNKIQSEFLPYTPWQPDIEITPETTAIYMKSNSWRGYRVCAFLLIPCAVIKTIHHILSGMIRYIKNNNDERSYIMKWSLKSCYQDGQEILGHLYLLVPYCHEKGFTMVATALQYKDQYNQDLKQNQSLIPFDPNKAGSPNLFPDQIPDYYDNASAPSCPYTDGPTIMEVSSEKVDLNQQVKLIDEKFKQINLAFNNLQTSHNEMVRVNSENEPFIKFREENKLYLNFWSNTLAPLANSNWKNEIKLNMFCDEKTFFKKGELEKEIHKLSLMWNTIKEKSKNFVDIVTFRREQSAYIGNYQNSRFTLNSKLFHTRLILEEIDQKIIKSEITKSPVIYIKEIDELLFEIEKLSSVLIWMGVNTKN